MAYFFNDSKLRNKKGIRLFYEISLDLFTKASYICAYGQTSNENVSEWAPTHRPIQKERHALNRTCVP